MSIETANPWTVREQQARLEREGVLLVSRVVPGWRFWVRPLNDWNKEYHAAIARMLRTPAVADYAKKAAAAADYVPNEAESELDWLMQANPFIEGCLVGWSGVTGPDGQPYAFNPDNARALLRHFPNVFAELRAFARRPNIAALTLADPAGLARGNS